MANMSATTVNTPIMGCIKENLEKDPTIKTILKLMKKARLVDFGRRMAFYRPKVVAYTF